MSRKLILLIVFVISLVGISCKKDVPGIFLDQNLTFQGFNPLWKLYLESSKGGWQNNDNGRFTNDDAPALQSLVTLFELTNDNRYLDTFQKVASKILLKDDVNRQVQDFYRNDRILPGWSSTRYTPGNKRTIFLANDALILIPMLRLHNTLTAKGIAARYNTSQYVQRAEQEFNVIFSECWTSVSTDQGYFQDKYYSSIGLNMPLNQIATVGLMCLELYKATGNATYQSYAIKTANYVKQHLILKDNSYVWYYKKPSVAFPEIVYDDFSHAQLVVYFITEMNGHGMVFSQSDIDKVVNTFLYQVMDNDRVYFYFGGFINETTPLPPASKYVQDPWLTYYYLLTPFSSSVKNKLIQYNNSKRIIYDSNSDYNHIGEFVLLHFANHLKYVK